jgi:hypothetical protein
MKEMLFDELLLPYFGRDEGDVETAPGVYQIPLSAILPKREETSNLLVVAAPSGASQ